MVVNAAAAVVIAAVAAAAAVTAAVAGVDFDSVAPCAAVAVAAGSGHDGARMVSHRSPPHSRKPRQLRQPKTGALVAQIGDPESGAGAAREVGAEARATIRGASHGASAVVDAAAAGKEVAPLKSRYPLRLRSHFLVEHRSYHSLPTIAVRRFRYHPRRARYSFGFHFRPDQPDHHQLLRRC